MKKNKRMILLLALCIVSCVISCADTGEKISTENTQTTGMGLDLSAMKYQQDTDAQPNFINSKVTKSDRGYYFWSPTGTFSAMMFYDIQSKQAVPLCNRPDCDHLNNDCNAYYKSIFAPGEGDGFDVMNYVQFYDGSLYVIGCDDEDYVNLYKISADGSSRERDTRLYKADFSATEESASKDWSGWVSPFVCIHRGYAYFVDNREKVPKLRRIKLGGTETEMIYEAVGTQSKVYRMEAYGDYLFFQTSDYTNYTEENPKPDGGIYVYELKTGKVRLVKKDVIATYAIADDMLYYFLDNTIWSCSLVTSKENLLVKDVCGMDFSIDEQYIYIFDKESATLETYDKKGKLVGSVGDKNLTGYYGGCDSQYLFITGSTAEVQHGTASKEVTTEPVTMEELIAEDKSFMGIIELSELQKGNGKWNYFFYSKYQTAD